MEIMPGGQRAYSIYKVNQIEREIVQATVRGKTPKNIQDLSDDTSNEAQGLIWRGQEGQIIKTLVGHAKELPYHIILDIMDFHLKFYNQRETIKYALLERSLC